MAARLRRLAELREGQARRERTSARGELEAAQEALEGLDDGHARAEAELLGSDEPLTGAHLQLLQDGRMSHRGRRRAQEGVIVERGAEHDARIAEHERAIGNQRGKEVLEDRMKRELREEYERQEGRELDEIAGGRSGGTSDDSG